MRKLALSSLVLAAGLSGCGSDDNGQTNPEVLLTSELKTSHSYEDIADAAVWQVRGAVGTDDGRHSQGSRQVQQAGSGRVVRAIRNLHIAEQLAGLGDLTAAVSWIPPVGVWPLATTSVAVSPFSLATAPPSTTSKLATTSMPRTTSTLGPSVCPCPSDLRSETV